MKLFLTLLTIPHLIACFFLSKNKSIIKDLVKCVDYIKKEKKSFSMIDDYYYHVLITAEDHRNPIHYGIDPIAIIRCIYLRLTKRITQGGSTVEQQLVRTLTGRYEKTLRRKIREQVIAILLSKAVQNKKHIGKAYLHCAYFGHTKVGFSKLSVSDKKDPSELIARLKYPTRKNEDPCSSKKIKRRKEYIDDMLKKQVIFLEKRHTDVI
ncbi:transglycosylase domain-containing protein [Enterobacter asburiae]|uniref:transglycosylase domain-containing protein n=1 Tax=Enterobacter asburiae TaxID=61645 RepID=UPI0021484F37|nr:transglycosylase domain-containing protein [Enterobacter asburiae]UUR73710.1 transglycosylase domain-containing protein [Enterobacter asburiae]